MTALSRPQLHEAVAYIAARKALFGEATAATVVEVLEERLAALPEPAARNSVGLMATTVERFEPAVSGMSEFHDDVAWSRRAKRYPLPPPTIIASTMAPARTLSAMLVQPAAGCPLRLTASGVSAPFS